MITGIFCSFHSFSSLIYHLFSSHSLFPPLLERFVGICASQNAIAACRDDTSSVVCAVLMQFISSLPYPDATTGILRLSIFSRIARNNSLGIATSAIWKITCREWCTPFAPILMSFSRNVVNDQ